MSHKIHILHIVYKLSTGGLENGLVNLINTLPSNEFEHTILSLTTQDNFSTRVLQKNVRVICLMKKPGPLSLYCLPIISMIKKIDPDILHTRNFSTLETQWMGWVAGVKCRLHSEHGRDINDIHGLNVKTNQIRKWMRIFIQEYIALSKDLEQYLLQKIKVKPSKCHQVYNGVDTLKFVPIRQKSHTPFVILTVGRLDPVKNISSLIEGFRGAVESLGCCELWIVGDGPEASKLKALATRYNLLTQIKFLGQRDDLESIMPKADLYIQSSLYEGISNTLLEAMSCGLCVVATAVGGNPEIIEHGKNGWLIAPNRPKSITESILKLYQDEAQRHYLAKVARETVCHHFSLKAMSQNYYNLYTARRETVCVA